MQIIGIIGAGQMGRGIAIPCLKAGFQVILTDKSQKSLDQSTEFIHKIFKKEGLDLPSQTQLKVSLKMEDAAGADLLIEAVTEHFETKIQILKQIEAMMKPGAYLATNTSSYVISGLGQHLQKPENFIGLHFMNPAHKMPLVEVIPSSVTTSECLNMAKGIVTKLDKTAVVAPDSPGFVVNRLLIPMINEACHLSLKSHMSFQDIDSAMKLGAHFPMGPFELADFIGIDTCLAIMQTLYDDLMDAKYEPAELLKHYASIGQLGRKVGHGFYDYPSK